MAKRAKGTKPPEAPQKSIKVRKYFTTSTWAAIDQEIVAAANSRTETEAYKDGRGPSNADLVADVHDAIFKIVAPFLDAAIDEIIAKRVSIVLRGGKSDSDGAQRELDLPVTIPLWLAVPAEEDEPTALGEVLADPTSRAAAMRWRRQDHVSPNELKRIMDHEDEIIKGHTVYRDRVALIRSEALKKGCDPDASISTVFKPKPDEAAA